MDASQMLAALEHFMQQLAGRSGLPALPPPPTQPPTASSVPQVPIPAYNSHASSSSATLPLAPTLAPRIDAYVSRRIVSDSLAHGHPPAPPPDAVAYPILGQAQLAVPMSSNTAHPRLPNTNGLTFADISTANDQRTVAMQAHALPSTRLPLRPAHASTSAARAPSSRISSSAAPAPSRRRRGRAERLPALTDARAEDPSDVRSIFGSDPAGNEMVDLMILVHPLMDTELTHVPRHQKGSFIRELDSLNLRFPLTLPSNTPVIRIQERVAAAMERGTTAWKFARPSAALSAGMVPSELLDLQFLRLKSKRGMANLTTGAFDLEKVPNDDGLLLGRIARHKQYALSDVTVAHKTLDLHLLIVRAGASCITSIGNAQITRHDCVTDAFNAQFSLDHERGRNQSGWTHPECTCDTPSDGEDIVADNLLTTESEEDELDNDHPAPAPPSQAIPMTRQRAADIRNAAVGAANLNAPSPTLLASPDPEPIDVDVTGDEAIDIELPDASLPITRARPHAALYEAGDFFQAICRKAMRNSLGVGALDISGANLDDAASKMILTVTRCAQANDFTHCLSTTQEFAIRREDRSGWSTGHGPCKEINLAALHWFTNKSEWVTPKTPGRVSVALTSKDLEEDLFSRHRLLAAKTFGAIVGLSMARGVAPEMLEPALLQLAANDGNPASLSPDFLREFYPALVIMLAEMDAIGPDGDLATSPAIVEHLATHYDMQVAALRHRSVVLHNRLASEMVLVATVGAKGARHPEIRAFIDGFNLPCANGLMLGDIMRSHANGTSAYICHSLTTVIHDTDSLLSVPVPVLRVRAPSAPTLVRFNGHLGNPIDLDAIFLSFLRGTGVPSRHALQAADRRISPLVRIQLDKVDSPSFRPRMLCWAATGHPQIMLAERDYIEVRWVNAGDPYHPELTVNSEVATELMKAGKLTFRCCLNQMKIPVLHLDTLLSQTYPIGDITAVEQAIESWLFIEILEAIGGNSIL